MAKVPTEDGLVLDVSTLVKLARARGDRSGVARWPGGSSVSWRITSGLLSLAFTVDGEPIEQVFPLVETPRHFGGTMAWVRCRLVVGDVPCRNPRLCRCLYRRPGVPLFGCRRCLDLTYASRLLWGPARHATPPRCPRPRPLIA
jgi:hypothetical protein